MPSSKLERRTSKLTPMYAARMPKPALRASRTERESVESIRVHLLREASLWIPGRYVLVSGMEMERRAAGEISRGG